MRALILLALLGAAVAVPRNQHRIVGGSATTVETYPYISNLQYLWSGYFWSQACGGTLINNRAVLSAAHCFDGDHHSEWRVRLGTTQRESGGTVFSVSQLILHPQWNGATMDHDVAIVRLSSAATFGPSIGVASVPGAAYNLADGTKVTTVGWGDLTHGGVPSNQLQHVNLDIINQQLCAQRYAQLRNYPDITDNMICAGILNVGGKDACQGDSGGPLMHNNVVVGIVSWGADCAHPIYPGVNARVNRYTNWIVANS